MNNNKSQKLYLVDGNEIAVTRLRELILDAVGDEKITSIEIAKRINANYKDIKGAITSMVAYRMLNTEGCKSSTVYFINNPCPLQQILHPEPNFEGRIKSVYKHTEDKDRHSDYRMKNSESFNASILYYLED